MLKAFDCQEFEDGSRYLKADYSISCDSVTYDFIYVSKALDNITVKTKVKTYHSSIAQWFNTVLPALQANLMDLIIVSLHHCIRI